MIERFRVPRLNLGNLHLPQKMAVGGKRLAEFLTLSLGHDALWPQQSLCVCLERGGLSIVYGRRIFSRITIRNARSFPYEKDAYPTPDALVSNLRIAATNFEVSLKEVTLVLPREWTTARTAALPVAVKANIAQAVAFELDRLTPLAADDALYDFHTLAEDNDKLRLFLALCRADIVMPYVQALAAQGIRVARIGTTFGAMGAWSTYLRRAPSVAFAEIGPLGYEGVLVIDQRLAGVWGDTFDGIGPDEKAKSVKDGIGRLLESATNGTPIGVAILLLDEHIPTAAIRSTLATAETLNGLDRKKLHMKEALPSLTAAQSGSVVESLWPRAEAINLLSKGVRKPAKTPFSLTVLLVAAILAISAMYAIIPLSIEQKRLAEIERQLKLIKPSVRQIEALKKEIEAQEKEIGTIENFKKGRPLTIDLIKEITNVLPKSVWLTRARITETTVELEGYAGSASEVLPKLEASPFLKKVEFSSPTFRDTRLNADRFVIKMEIESEKRPDIGGTSGGTKK